MKTIYAAHAQAVGGRNGYSKTEDSRLSFKLSIPGAASKMQSSNLDRVASEVVTNPEELFACGYAACFGTALEYVAGLQKISVAESLIQADVSLNQDEKGFSLAVKLTAAIPNLDHQTAERLIEAAHQVCPYSKAVHGNVDVALEVKESGVGETS